MLDDSDHQHKSVKCNSVTLFTNLRNAVTILVGLKKHLYTLTTPYRPLQIKDFEKMQDLLTALAEALVLVFSAVFLLDLAIVLNNCWIASAHTPQLQAPAAKPHLQPEKRAIAKVLPDPWMLPIDEVAETSITQRCSPNKSKPLLLLPQSDVVVASSLTTIAESTLEELFLSIDIDKLQIRLARKIAKALGIAQKVNKKDQPISWLRAQIKAKLQQPQELPTTAILAVRELLAS